MFSVIKSLRNLLSHLGKYKKYVRLAYPIAILESTMAFVPYMLLFYMIRVSLQRKFDMRDVYLVGGIMILSVALRAILKRILDKLQQDKGYYAFAENRLKLTDHLAKLNMGYYTDSNIGNITSVVTTDISFIEEQAVMQMGVVISSLAKMIPSAVFLFLFDYRLGFAYLGLLFLGAISLDRFIACLNKHSRKRQDNFATLSYAVLNYIRGIQTIKAFCMQKEKDNAMDDTIDQTKKGALDLVRDVILPNHIFIFFSTIPTFVMIFLVTYLMLYHGFNLAFGLGFIVFSFILFVPLTLIRRSSEILGISDAAIMRYREIMAEKEQYNHTNGQNIPKKMNICFEDVSFAYENKEVLQHIDLEIKDKTFTALVGKSGSGKTTIANLIARFWDIEKGSIRIDGILLQDIPIEELHANISMVFQNVYLFQDTVLNNIAFGNPKATKEDVIKAAKKARCHEFIMKLENGYNTVIGEGGSSLSGGEKQRISIARAILKDAPLILLDEATAGVDPENERFIQEAIDELVKNKTLVVIAHRLSTIQHADQIVYLEKGRIIEKGTHEELVNLAGQYKRQYDFYRKTKIADKI